MMETSKRAVGINEFSHLFSISRDTTKRAIRRGDLRSIRLAGRVLIPCSEVERVAHEGLIPQKPVVPDFELAASDERSDEE